MSEAQYRRCWDEHRAIGTFGWPALDVLTPKSAHFSTVTCGSDPCIRSANRECRKITGHNGEFRPFKSTRERAS